MRGLPALREKMHDLRIDIAADEKRREELAAAWHRDPISDARARETLRSLGADLASLDQVPPWGARPDLEGAVVDLCVYFKAPRDNHKVESLLKSWVDGLVPGMASAAIRKAVPSPPRTARRRVDVPEFGVFLIENADLLCTGKAADLHQFNDAGLLVSLRDSRLTDSCGEEPIELNESLLRLHTQISNASLSSRTVNRFAIGLAVVAASVLAIFIGQWSTLGLRDSLHGVGSVLPGMMCVLIGSIGIGAAVREAVTFGLGNFGIARAKTLNKCSAAMLAFGTILLGAGLSSGTSGNTSIFQVYSALFVYALIVVTTVAAELMVNVGEARLKEIQAKV